MPVIYEPRGKAREYSELACNLYTGCVHKCKYCYCPSILRTTLNAWAESPRARTDIIKKLSKEADKRFLEEKEVLFCFMSDPYQSDEAAYVTRKALEVLETNKFQNVNVLTKAGFRATQDFDILKRNNWKLGSTVCFRSENLRREWEEGAPSIVSRYEAIKEANRQGIYTWVSVEPVIDPEEALKVIEDLLPFVDYWKVGKLNHHKEIESKINWKDFYLKVKAIIPEHKVYFKDDLLKEAGVSRQ